MQSRLFRFLHIFKIFTHRLNQFNLKRQNLEINWSHLRHWWGFVLLRRYKATIRSLKSILVWSWSWFDLDQQRHSYVICITDWADVAWKSPKPNRWPVLNYHADFQLTQILISNWPRILLSHLKLSWFGLQWSCGRWTPENDHFYMKGTMSNMVVNCFMMKMKVVVTDTVMLIGTLDRFLDTDCALMIIRMQVTMVLMTHLMIQLMTQLMTRWMTQLMTQWE